MAMATFASCWCCLMPPTAGLAAAGHANVVYLVSGPGSETPIVLVPRVLWQQVQERGRAAGNVLPDHLLLGGKFRVEMRGEVAVVDAILRLRATQRDPSSAR